MTVGLRLELLTSPDCKPCEVLQKLLDQVIAEHRGELGKVEIKLIDVLSEPELVIRYGVLSTPALAINGSLCFVGVPKKSELAQKMIAEARGH